MANIIIKWRNGTTTEIRTECCFVEETLKAISMVIAERIEIVCVEEDNECEEVVKC